MDSRKGTTYTFRRYEPGDVHGFLDLFEHVWGECRSEDWFRWRFEDNPYVDHVPMFVAEADGAVVGTRPFLAFRMRVGSERPVGMLTVDTMVHPEHRRRGLFTTMTEQSLAYYAARDVAFVFNQPNARSRPGFLSLGFRELDFERTYYRVHRPSEFLHERGIPGADVLSPAGDRLARWYLGLRDGRRGRTDGVDIRRRSGVAAEELADLFRRAETPGITTYRDESFFDWRFASPEWSRDTVIASSDGDDVIGIVARRRTTEAGITVTQVADIVPPSGGPDWKQGLAACLNSIIDEAADNEVVAAPGRVFPADLAMDFGFLPNDRVPIAPFAATDATLCVRSLRDHGHPWEIDGVSLTDPTNWLLSYAERDTT